LSNPTLPLATFVLGRAFAAREPFGPHAVELEIDARRF
jgi:hypothetical protein